MPRRFPWALASTSSAGALAPPCCVASRATTRRAAVCARRGSCRSQWAMRPSPAAAGSRISLEASAPANAPSTRSSPPALRARRFRLIARSTAPLRPRSGLRRIGPWWPGRDVSSRTERSCSSAGSCCSCSAATRASNLGKLLTNRFSVPGSEAEKGLNILRDALQRARRRRVHAGRALDRRRAAAGAVEQAAATGREAAAPRQSTAATAGGPGRLLRADTDAAAGGRRQEPHDRDAPRDRHGARREDLPDRLSGARARRAADLQQRPQQRRGDRGPDRDRRAVVHVRHPRRGDRPARCSRPPRSRRRSDSCG